MKAIAHEKTVRVRSRAAALLRSALTALQKQAIPAGLPHARVCAAGLLLSMPAVGGYPLPLAACLAAAVPFGLDTSLAALGAGLGYLLFFPLNVSIEQAALTLLIAVGVCIFRGTPLPRPLLTGSLAGVIGTVFLLETGLSAAFAAQYVLKLLLAVFAPQLYRRALTERVLSSRLLLGALLLTGPVQLLPPFGALAALAVCAALPSVRLRQNADLPQAQTEAQTRLRRGAAVFAELSRSLTDSPPADSTPQIAEVYDFAAEQVCRHCVCSAVCWEDAAEETYRDLCLAAEPIMRRGLALREDLPPRFEQRCRHTEGFLTAVNQALDEGLSRRQLRSRQRESRQILADQYLFFSRWLGTLAQSLREPPPEPPRFCPELAVGSAGRTGSSVSGDRGATLRDGRGGYCVLLCDGMGTGEAARAESDRAVRLLTGLLDAGAVPDAAMGLLNDCYVLRQTTCFSTVDLLRLDLRSGTGVLYKWGAAPSYLLCGGELRKIGTASPPPGCGVGPSHAAAQYPLSLRDGETLILVSDGAFGAQTEARVRAFGTGSVRDLAGRIVSGGDGSHDDDRTAVVLRLRRIERIDNG